MSSPPASSSPPSSPNSLSPPSLAASSESPRPASPSSLAAVESTLAAKSLSYDPDSLASSFQLDVGCPNDERMEDAEGSKMLGRSVEELQQDIARRREEMTDVLGALLVQMDGVKKAQVRQRDELAELAVCVDDCEPLHHLPPFLQEDEKEVDAHAWHADRITGLLMGPTDFGIRSGAIGRANSPPRRRVKRRRLSERDEVQQNWTALTHMLGLNGTTVDSLTIARPAALE
eukprot:TRINITY_DN12610_c0_g1_i1.p1 TRINITY_DN12610_c0_g1~~TRINITY_DN12610_c0_g1_i1.p1  ORF type:complete len:231 (-),score=94.65 TRINITY_DN12610_c0_g1_i1:474-1166(-)